MWTDGRTGGREDMTKEIVAFHNYVKAPKNLFFSNEITFNPMYLFYRT